MRMTTQDAELSLRNLNAGLLRALAYATANAVIRFNQGGPEMVTVALSLLHPIESLVRHMEEPWGKDNIPAPPAVKAKSDEVIKRVALELQQLCDEIFAAG
jgi:hypothetical protein